MRRVALAILLSSCLSSAAAAQLVPPQNSRPEPTAKVDTIPPARDVAFPGTMQLTVDASDVTRAIFKIHQHVPVPAAGDFHTLTFMNIPLIIARGRLVGLVVAILLVGGVLLGYGTQLAFD